MLLSTPGVRCVHNSHHHPTVVSSEGYPACRTHRARLSSTCPLHQTSCASRIAATATAAGQGHERVTLHQYDDFELLWLEYRHELSISKEAAVWTLEDVQLGVLPCDAELLKERAQEFIASSDNVSKLDTRRLLNASRSFLLYDSRYLQDTIKQLLQLLPRSPYTSTQLLLDTAADLDLPPEVVALQHQELDLLFQAALGSKITCKPFHYLMNRLRRHLVDVDQGPQQSVELFRPQRQQLMAGSAFQHVLQTSAGVSQQLRALRQLLGPEVAHAAVQNTPQLLDAPFTAVQAGLQWLQQQLRLSPVAAMLLAEQLGDVLLLPTLQLDQNYSSLCYLLQQLVGWHRRQVHSLLYNSPELLTRDSQQLARNWQQIQRLSRKRQSWLRELAAAEAPLLSAVLSCHKRQLFMLQYAAETGALKDKSLLQMLRMDYVDLITACPSYRTWRSMAPGRWRLVDAPNSPTNMDASFSTPNSGWQGANSERMGTDAPAEQAVPAGRSRNRGQEYAPQKSATKVLAVDKLKRPVLVQVGELGPYDRLA